MSVDPIQPDAALSADGRARRDAMLSELLREVERSASRRRARRRAVRAAGALAVLAAAVTAVLVTRPTVAPQRESAPSPLAASARTIEIVATDPSVLARYLAPATPIEISRYVVDDDELLAIMERAGRPSGLARSGGRTWLVALSLPARGPQS